MTGACHTFKKQEPFTIREQLGSSSVYWLGPCCSSSSSFFFVVSVLCLIVLFFFVLCLESQVVRVSGLSIRDFPFGFL